MIIIVSIIVINCYVVNIYIVVLVFFFGICINCIFGFGIKEVYKWISCKFDRIEKEIDIEN